MEAYKSYIIRPQQYGIDVSYAPDQAPYPYGAWGSKNYRIYRNALVKRWGYNTVDRTYGSTANAQLIRFKVKGGTVYTLCLTASDLCYKETSGSNTFSYKTDTYTTGTIDSITGTAVVGSGTSWSTYAAAGDYFIMNSDHSSQVEPDSNWVAISSVTDDTHLTLAASYTKNGTGYKIRKVYTTPSNERWSHAIVNDKFCFSNGNTNVQYWSGSGYAADLDATYAVKARYIKEFANRLVIADHGSTRDPMGLAWSGEGDPTDWTSDTSGSTTWLETRDYITGLGKVGANLIVYFSNGIRTGYQSGEYYAPIKFNPYIPGTGCAAPYSIIEANRTNYFVGRNDIYEMVGDRPSSIGESIRDKLFDITLSTEIERVFGGENNFTHEVMWLFNTTEGQKIVSWDYFKRQWYVYEYPNISIIGYGMGGI